VVVKREENHLAKKWGLAEWSFSRGKLMFSATANLAESVSKNLVEFDENLRTSNCEMRR
jgi:hypothetical protein